MSDKSLEKRVDKVEDQQKIFIEDIAIIKTEITDIKDSSQEIKKTVFKIQTDLIDGERKSLKEFSVISDKFTKAIGNLKSDMQEVLNQRILNDECIKEDEIIQLQEFQRDHELAHSEVSGELKGIRKVLHYIWAPLVILCYVIWDKFLSKIFHSFFS